MPAPEIKICGIATTEAVHAALQAGASHVGFVFFAPSLRNVAIELAARLAAQAREGAKVVGLFVDPDRDLIDSVRSKVTLDVIQLHGEETPATAARIKQQHGLEVWKAVPVRRPEDLALARKYVGSVNRVLYDAKAPPGEGLPGGNGLRFDWNLLARHQHALPWILAGGLDRRNVAEAMRVTSADFLDVSSGVERAPGIKDPALIAAFCKAARAA